MNKQFLRYPNEQILYELNTRGKLVFHLTNGKYITFDPDEINTWFGLLSNGYPASAEVTVEPYRTRIYECCGSYKKNVITKIIDRTNKIYGVYQGGLGGLANLTTLHLPNMHDGDRYCMLSCPKLSDLYIPEIRHIGPDGLAGSAIKEFTARKMTDIGWAYQPFAGCTKLEKLNLPNLILFSGNDTNSWIYNTPKLKELYFPNLKYIDSYYHSMGYFKLNSQYLERMIFPNLEKILINSNEVFKTETGMKYALFGKMTVETVKARNAFGLPSGCVIDCSNGTYTVI